MPRIIEVFTKCEYLISVCAFVCGVCVCVCPYVLSLKLLDLFRLNLVLGI
jgi:hypothetical protein